MAKRRRHDFTVIAETALQVRLITEKCEWCDVIRTRTVPSLLPRPRRCECRRIDR